MAVIDRGRAREPADKPHGGRFPKNEIVGFAEVLYKMAVIQSKDG